MFSSVTMGTGLFPSSLFPKRKPLNISPSSLIRVCTESFPREASDLPLFVCPKLLRLPNNPSKGPSDRPLKDLPLYDLPLNERPLFSPCWNFPRNACEGGWLDTGTKVSKSGVRVSLKLDKGDVIVFPLFVGAGCCTVQ